MHIFDFDTYQVVVRRNDDIRKLYLELTGACNLDCRMCFRRGFSETAGDMSPALVDRVKESILALPRLRKVVFGGIGEALLHPRAREIIAFVAGRGISAVVCTNGRLLESHADFLVEAGVDRVVVSLETGEVGHPEEAHPWEAMRRIAEQRRRTRRLKPIVAVQIVVHRSNLGGLRSLAPRIRDAGVSEVAVSNLMPVEQALVPLVLYPGPEPPEVAAFRASLSPFIVVQTARFELKTERGCPFLEESAAVVAWDGHVSPCYRFLHAGAEFVAGKRKEILRLSFGNLLETPLLDIWNARPYAWFKYCFGSGLYPSCLDCALRDGCQYTEDTASDCWGNENSCADCLWGRKMILCP